MAIGYKSSDDVVIVSLNNGSESDELREEFRQILLSAAEESGLPLNELRTSVHLGGHGAAWEAYGLFTTLTTLYGAYKMCKDGLEVAEDVKKVYSFTQRIPNLIASVRTRAGEAYQRIKGHEAPSLVSISEPTAALLAFNWTVENYNPNRVRLVSYNSFPSTEDPAFKGKPHTYPYIYEYRIEVDDCHQIVFVEHAAGVKNGVHIVPWGCQHDTAERLTIC